MLLSASPMLRVLAQDDTVVEKLVLVAIRRADALEAFQAGALRRADLEAAIGVSRTTAHRVIRTLSEQSLVRRIEGGYVLTPLGEVVAEEVAAASTKVQTARRLQPFLEAFAESQFDIDVARFADATVTESGPGDPYAPLARFMELLQASESLRGFDTTSIAPIFVDEIREAILDGMQASVIYHPPVVDQIADAYPESLRDALDSGRLELFTNPDLPLGLVLFDDRIGLGAYDDETGMLTTFVDTDDPAAIRWGTSVYEYYRASSERFDLGASGTV